MRYWSRKHNLAEVDVSDRKYGRRNWVGHLREGREARYADCGAGVVAVGLGRGEQLELEFIILGSRDGEEGGDWRSDGWELVQRPCNGWIRVIEGGECGEEDFPLCFLEVQVGGRGCHYKEREAFRVSFSALTVVNASEECIWRREECGGMAGLEFEALQLKIAVKYRKFYFYFIFLANDKAEKKVRRANLSTYSRIFLPVLVNFQLSLLGNCQVIIE